VYPRSARLLALAHAGLDPPGTAPCSFLPAIVRKRGRFLARLVAGGLLVLTGSARAADAGSAPISGDVPEAAGWRAEVVVGGLSHPWSIAWLPDGSASSPSAPAGCGSSATAGWTRRPFQGCRRCSSPGREACSTWRCIRLRRQPARLFHFCDRHGRRKSHRARARRLEGNALRDTEVIFQNADAKPGAQHFGSRIVWLPDGSLLMSIGDGGNPPTRFAGENIRNQAQNPGTHFGKILRLKDDGTPHPDNPVRVSRAQGPRSGRWATGTSRHDARSGQQPRLGERARLPRRRRAERHRRGSELRLASSELQNEYWGPRVAEKSSRPGIVEPRLVWTPRRRRAVSRSITGIDFLNGRAIYLAGR